MSRNGTLLPIPDDATLRFLINEWPEPWAAFPYPRSVWLRQFEAILAEHYPNSSAADKRLTARHAAPFPLKDGPNVP